MQHLHDHYEQAPSGLFVLNVFRRGELVERFEEKNLIVDGARATHARLIGGDVASRSIASFGVGTNGTAPVGGNTGLTNALIKPLSGAPSYPAANQVAFPFSLDTTEANGIAILEFGLFTAGGTLYARKVRANPLYKESDISLAGTWTITF